MKQIKSAELVQYNANDRGKRVGDCVKRSISLAFGISYSEASKLLNETKKEYGYPAWNIMRCFSKVIESLGGDKYKQLQDVMTVDEFADTCDKDEIYLLLCGPKQNKRNHMVCVRDGKIWDSWNSKKNIVDGYYLVDESVTKPIVDLSDNMEELGDFAEAALFKTMDAYATKKKWDYILTTDQSEQSFKIVVYATLMVREGEGDNRKKRTYCVEIPFIVEPTQTLDEAKASIAKVAKTKGYDRMYAINQQEVKLQEEQEIERRFREAGGDPKYGGNNAYLSSQERKFLNTLPGWIKPLIIRFELYGPNNWGEYEYDLIFHPHPDDWRRSPKERIRFQAWSADELRHYINEYANSEYWDVAGEDYEYGY